MGKILIQGLILKLLSNSSSRSKSCRAHRSPLGCQNIRSADENSLLGILKLPVFCKDVGWVAVCTQKVPLHTDYFSSIYCSPLCAGVYARLSLARCRDRSGQVPIRRSALPVRPQGSTHKHSLWGFCWCSIAGNDLDFLRSFLLF